MAHLKSRIDRLEQPLRVTERRESIMAELRERQRQTEELSGRIREECTQRGFVQGDEESLAEVWSRSMSMLSAELKKELQACARCCGRRYARYMRLTGATQSGGET